MGTGYQANKARGSKARCGVGQCRASTTISIALFERIRASAKGRYASVSEEIAKALAKQYPIPTKLAAEASPPDGTKNHHAENPN
jgi:hypothetical protein